jgi:signal transduction histidine kinase
MVFGGFSGATAFYPTRIGRSAFVPKTVLTDFQLSGNAVPIGSGSPLKKSITYADNITLSHSQNIFSIEFSALSYFNAPTNRYRYRLEGLDNRWHEVGSDQRTASYTTLPAATYTFDVQGKTSRGQWSEPGARLRIEILPAWYQTFLFRAACAAVFFVFLCASYKLRLQYLTQQFSMRLEERVNERTRIARDLHDTMLQSFQAALLQLHAITYLLPHGADNVRQKLESVIEQARQAVTEGRDAVQGLRSSTVVTNDLAEEINTLGAQLVAAAGQAGGPCPEFRVQVEGGSRDLAPLVRDEVHRIACEALRNAFLHAHTERIEVEIRYDRREFRLRVTDNGKGIDQKVLGGGGREGHYGLPGMHERAKLVGGKLAVFSKLDSGTEILLTLPASRAYSKSPALRRGISA